MSTRVPGSSAFSSPRAVEEEDCNACDLLGSVKGNPFGSLPPMITKVPAKAAPQRPQQVSSDAPVAPLAGTPPGIVQIGNSGWTILHSIAAYFPERPSQEHQADARQFITSFSRLFPCKWCADDFREYIEEHPPRVESRHELSQWMCEAHNSVNYKLGKPQFDCNLVDQRWRRVAKKPLQEATKGPDGH